jgi:predicted small lipoprotein YifL
MPPFESPYGRGAAPSSPTAQALAQVAQERGLRVLRAVCRQMSDFSSPPSRFTSCTTGLFVEDGAVLVVGSATTTAMPRPYGQRFHCLPGKWLVVFVMSASRPACGLTGKPLYMPRGPVVGYRVSARRLWSGRSFLTLVVLSTLGSACGQIGTPQSVSCGQVVNPPRRRRAGGSAAVSVAAVDCATEVGGH